MQPFPFPMSAPINPTLMPPRMVTVIPNPGHTFAPPPQMFVRPMMPRHVIVAPPMVHKPITLYVGQLSAKVKDDFFDKLLAYCGPLKSWKRITKSFGFVEFQNSDGALRATRLLNGWPLFGKKLLINADKESTKELDRYVLDVKIGKIRPMTRPGDDGRGKTGEQIMAEQDAVATTLITELIAAEAEKQDLTVNEEKEVAIKTRTPSKSRSRSRERATAPPSGSSRSARVESSSRKRSSRSSKRDRRKRSRSRSGRSDSRYRIRRVNIDIGVDRVR
jgi:RNA recognition motif-containing protein